MLTLRFPDGGLEAEFRAHYVRTFINYMRAAWWMAALFWLLGTVSDAVLFPEFVGEIRPIRLVTNVIVLTAAVLTCFPDRMGPRLHLVAACASIAGGLGSISMFAIVGYPRGVTYFISLVGVMVVVATFIGILKYEYAVIACSTVFLVFLIATLGYMAIGLDVSLRMATSLGGFTAISLVGNYVAERYARENFLQRRALAEKVAELEASERRALDANRAKSVFLSNMSHELRTPLNAVLGFAQLMERDASISATGRTNLKTIQRSGEHLLDLINDVLAISKIEAGKVTLAEKPFDPTELFESVVEMVRVRAKAKSLSLEHTIAPAIPEAVIGDEGKLRQVLINLLGNAVKFTDRGGVALRVRWEGATRGRLVFEVEDTGHGISEEEIGKLFEPFSQTESGRKIREGTGLGLAISRNFVRLAGGDISVRSELGRGTVFTVELPCTASETVIPRIEAPRVVALEAGQPAWRILIADDTPDNRTLLRELLSPIGFELREAVNGREAVDVWQAWRPHAILLDMRMPVMDGREAARAIRSAECSVLSAESKNPEHTELPSDHSALSTQHSALNRHHSALCKIIALTASAFEHERGEILAAGCDAFLSKPFREAALFEALVDQLGARFVYEGEQEQASVESGEDIPTRLAALASEHVDPLRAALVAGDLDAANAALSRIAEVDATLAEQLRREVRAYRIEEIIELLE